MKARTRKVSSALVLTNKNLQSRWKYYLISKQSFIAIILHSLWSSGS